MTTKSETEKMYRQIRAELNRHRNARCNCRRTSGMYGKQARACIVPGTAESGRIAMLGAHLERAREGTVSK